MYRIVILRVVSYWDESWSVTFREEHRLSAFENRFHRKIFWRTLEERDRKLKKNAIIWSSMMCVFYPVLLVLSNQGRWYRWGMWRAWGKRIEDSGWKPWSRSGFDE